LVPGFFYRMWVVGFFHQQSGAKNKGRDYTLPPFKNALFLFPGGLLISHCAF